MKRTLSNRVRNLFSMSALQCIVPRRFSPLETLESRTLLSGSVLVSVVGGNLIVRGDNAANVIVMDQTGLPAGQVRIPGDLGTSINNQPLPVVLSGITRSATIKMLGGADTVTLSNMVLPGALTVSDHGSG